MTVQELLADEPLRRHEFPVAAQKIFLAHGGVCPLPRRVAEAVGNYAHLATQDDQEEIVLAKVLEETRRLAATLVGAETDEIALVGPTSLALSFVAGGLAFHKGDNVLIYFDDYPSNVYPWMALADRGVEVRFLNVRQFGRIRPIDVIGQTDERTRLVALGSCHFVAGWRLELPAIGPALRERGIRFCVDGIQTLGAFPTAASDCDFMAADAHKWLLGPSGSGIFYVRRNRHEELKPTTWGWNNLKCPSYVAIEDLVWRSGARRYEAGSYGWLGLVGLRAALEFILELGVENIAAELLRKRAWLIPALQAKGWNVVNGDAPPANSGGIISVHREDLDLEACHRKMLEAGIVTSLRADRAGRKYIRLTPHFYNTDAELHRTLEFLG